MHAHTHDAADKSLLRPRVPLSRLLNNLGTTLLRPADPSSGLDAPVGGVVIFDPHDDLAAGTGDILLGVGVDDPAEVASLLRILRERGSAALVVKSPVPSDDRVTAAVEETGVALLGLARAASWAQVAELTRSVISVGEVRSDSLTLADAHGGDLFALANAIGALLDSPVTIEDRSSRVLAFSGGQDETDEGRVQTVLGRQVPQRYLKELQDRGVFRELAQTGGPLYIDGLLSGSKPRVAVAVRAGDELLGSMWAAVSGPLSSDRNKAFADAADLVALHMLRLRAGADVERRLQADLVATVLEGGPRATESASRLGLEGRPVRVVATQSLHLLDDATGESALHRLCDTVAVHFAALHPHAATALIGGVVYTLLPVDSSHDDNGEYAMSLAETFLARAGERVDAIIAVGEAAASLAGLPRSRQETDRVLRVLRTSHTPNDRRVARPADVQIASLLLRVSDLLAEDGDAASGPILALREYDATHHTALVESLRIYLGTMGNVNEAASRLQVHPNTLRYRIRRVGKISGLDLEDPDARLAATLMLRLGS
ncbi:MAG: helix-turn-helix domain-containing protein [Nocardioidaceae bacterium]